MRAARRQGNRFKSLTVKFKRPFNQPMNQQTMAGRIDGGNAVMVPLEVQRGRRDDAVADPEAVSAS